MIIDDREHDLIKQLTVEKIEFQVQRLPVGDILFENNGTTVIVERKRTDDFAASIMDGRWREQKTRLIASGAIVVYLIEGSLYGQRKSPSVLSSAIWNTMLRDNIWVLQTCGVQETSLHLQQLERKVGKEIKANGDGMITLLSKRKRKENNVQTLMLMAIPGVSEKIALAILSKYPTILSLQNQLKENAKELLSVVVTSKRKIGKKTVDRLCEFLL